MPLWFTSSNAGDPYQIDFYYRIYYNYYIMPSPITANQNSIDMMELRSQPGTVVDNVFYRNVSFVIKRRGKAQAVIVPLGEYADMQRRKHEAKDRFFAMTDELRASFAKEDPAKVQRMIEKAIEEVRREKRSSNGDR